MSLSVNTNLASLNSHRNLSATQGTLNKALERLSSGFRINRAADDAAGLAISEGLRSQIGGTSVAIRNAQDAISVVQTAEGAMTEVHSILQRVRDLSVQAANDSNSADARTAIGTEVNSLVSELTRIATSTNFNGTKLLNASAGAAADGKMKFHVGSGSAATDSIEVDLASADVSAVATALGSLDFTTSAGALAAVSTADAQIKAVSSARASLGAYQNRFEHTIRSLNVSLENLSASESRIRDADMAQEMMNFTRSQILQQAGTAMLAQANQVPQSVLQLLR